jgi:hypothetical protein
MSEVPVSARFTAYLLKHIIQMVTVGHIVAGME